MEMQLLGNSLQKILKGNQVFTNISLFNHYVVQMIRSLQYLHKIGYVHRDIKPDNYLIDNHNYQKLFTIDFGLIKKYLDD